MRVLAVDDEPHVLRSLEILLGERGHEVCPFTQVADACAALREGCFADAAVVDWWVGAATAEAVLASIRDCLPQACPVILISGHTDVPTLLERNPRGVHAFMAKPLDFDVLCDLLEGIPGCIADMRYRSRIAKEG